ncbi:MAG: peptide chain release factor aRF-1 [Candidatus Aenigmarchaeota archaeon]|nr:peptide chain release factor aRF-1 [Candidatus Aenigmarchaeota archaeon]
MTSKKELAKRRLKDLVEELENIKGRHTELVSVYIPAGYNINKVAEQINMEKSTAQNIKSKTVRKNVLAALEKITQHLKLYKQTPENGLVIFCGNVSEREGVADIELFALEPPEPLNQKLYWCDQKFVLDPLKDMIREKEVYGIIVLDKSEADIGILKGKKIIPVKHMESLVPGKTDKGGWCVHENTLLLLSDGRIEKIKNIGERKFVCYDFRSISIKHARHNHFFERKAEKAYLIETKSPTFSIVVTPEHKFFVPDANGFGEKSAEELQIGDNILLLKRVDVEGKTIHLNVDIPYDIAIKKKGRMFLVKRRKEMGLSQKDVARRLSLSQTLISKFENGERNLSQENLKKILGLYNIRFDEFEKKYIMKKKIISFPKKLNYDFLMFLGYVIGDGNRDKNRIVISEKNVRIAKYYKKIIEKLFSVNAGLRKREDKNYWEIKIYSKHVLDIISKLYPEILIPNKKDIPDDILMVKNKELSGFIRGFYDAEGWVDEKSGFIGVTVNRKCILEKLQLTFLRFGIVSSLSEVKNRNTYAKRYSLKITDINSIKNFYKYIGFTSNEKMRKIDKIIKRKSLSYIDQVPVSGVYIRLLANKLGLTAGDFPKVQDFFYDKKNMGYDVFKKNILPVFEKTVRRKPTKEAKRILQFLKSILHSNAISARISSKKIVRSKDCFYDMEVLKYNSFVANGIILHNSQARYARIREGLLNDFLKQVGETASKQFSELRDLKGIIIGGPGPVKDQFAEGEYLRYDFKQKVLGIVNTSYTGEYGLHETIERAEDVLKEASYMHEKKLLDRFFAELGKDNGLVVYGLKEVVQMLKSGNIETLLISEGFDWVKARVRCPKCGEEKELLMERKHLEGKKCPKCDELYEIIEEKSLTDEIIKIAEEMGTNVEIISSDTKEGSQFKELGGIGGILRYKIQ